MASCVVVDDDIGAGWVQESWTLLDWTMAF
jgi:hypothetical protein